MVGQGGIPLFVGFKLSVLTLGNVYVLSRQDRYLKNVIVEGMKIRISVFNFYLNSSGRPSKFRYGP
jgi:hypothetical protein